MHATRACAATQLAPTQAAAGIPRRYLKALCALATDASDTDALVRTLATVIEASPDGKVRLSAVQDARRCGAEHAPDPEASRRALKVISLAWWLLCVIPYEYAFIPAADWSWDLLGPVSASTGPSFAAAAMFPGRPPSFLGAIELDDGRALEFVRFCSEKRNARYPVRCVFHGSGIANWLSILRCGLQVRSGDVPHAHARSGSACARCTYR